MTAGDATYPLLLDDRTVAQAAPGAAVDAGLRVPRARAADEFRRPPHFGDPTGPRDLASVLRGRSGTGRR